MGARKAIRAEKMKAEKKQKAIAIMRDCPTSPRKMRLVADIIRGVEINKALGILRYSKKEASIRMEKLLKSAIANWEAKNESERLEDTKLAKLPTSRKQVHDNSIISDVFLAKICSITMQPETDKSVEEILCLK